MREQGSLSGGFLLVDRRQMPELYRQIKQTPRVASVTDKRAMVQAFDETVRENQRQMQFFNMIFAVIIAAGVVYNTARISLSERSRELATLRVIGFTRGEISSILLGELAVLTLAALPLGMVLGYLFSAGVAAAFESESYRIPVVWTRQTMGLAAAIVIAAAVVSGLAVRRRLDHLDLVAVLKAKE
jgi:putative ABC transport system permease protein